MNQTAPEPSRRILVVGMTGAGCAGLPEALIARVLGADLLVGGERHLDAFPAFGGERLSVRQGLPLVARRLRAALERGERAVVLASGDPLWYGIGASLRRWFAAEELEIIPAPTSYQLAFAALGEPWHDAALLSAHARPLDEVVRGVRQAPKAAILTDDRHSPAVIARALIEAGLAPTAACAVCENLGETGQRIVRTTLEDAAAQTFAPLNVLVVWRDASGQPPDEEAARTALPAARAPGLPDAAFSADAGLITKREVRLLSLAELALGPGEVLWDIGAGSGSVGIEAARAQPAATVYAVERRESLCERIRENLRRFPAPNFHLVHGEAPDACANLPSPDAIFIGGSGGRLGALLDLARRCLRPGGRLALNLVTLDRLHEARQRLPDARLYQVQISRGAPIQDDLRLEALNPVFVVTWVKEGADAS
ncbi:MAG: precorrin-6y C5,15-methyltransferase (decarboxylating) subunit CbiE [Oscillochloridaceae bacterium]|nr:precorrin-6y C5,15-methyltransferase (decarboxylating) subunit CbiE [Chloroflexaceae bacterium]MDW8391314.1 precorrin-6y C5,15-methyltransferase (decarboxylating) subunit CbiE [Oscillochloridaceae bacterium]